MARWTDESAEKKQRHELRRETILQAAAHCFNKRGYHGTTIGDIARQLGVSKAALYYYVKSKEEVLFLCHQASMDLGMDGLRRAEALGETAGERLRTALQYFIEQMAENLKGCFVMLEGGMLSPRLHRQVVKRRDEYEHRLRDLVAEGVASGAFVPCNPKLVVFAVLGAVNWVQKWYSPDGEVAAKDIAETFAAYLVRGLERRGVDVLLETGGEARVHITAAGGSA